MQALAVVGKLLRVGESRVIGSAVAKAHQPLPFDRDGRLGIVRVDEFGLAMAPDQGQACIAPGDDAASEHVDIAGASFDQIVKDSIGERLAASAAGAVEDDAGAACLGADGLDELLAVGGRIETPGAGEMADAVLSVAADIEEQKTIAAIEELRKRLMNVLDVASHSA